MARHVLLLIWATLLLGCGQSMDGQWVGVAELEGTWRQFDVSGKHELELEIRESDRKLSGQGRSQKLDWPDEFGIEFAIDGERSGAQMTTWSDHWRGDNLWCTLGLDEQDETPPILFDGALRGGALVGEVHLAEVCGEEGGQLSAPIELIRQ